MGSIVTGAIVGSVVAIVAAVVNYLAFRSRDTAQRKHDLGMQEARWDREDDLRDYEERRDLYATLLSHASGYRYGHALRGFEGKPDALDALNVDMQGIAELVEKIRLISSDAVYEAARDLENAIQDLRLKNLLEHHVEVTGTELVGAKNPKAIEEIQQADRNELNRTVSEAREAFLEAVSGVEGFERLASRKD
jgi:hypothetical protein